MYWIMLEKITFFKKSLILYGNITGTVGSYMYTMTVLCLNIAIGSCHMGEGSWLSAEY